MPLPGNDRRIQEPDAQVVLLDLEFVRGKRLSVDAILADTRGTLDDEIVIDHLIGIGADRRG